MIKAWAIGFLVLLTMTTLWYLFLALEVYSGVMVVFLWAAPLISAFVASCLAPSSNIILGASLGIPSALLAVLINTLVQLKGSNVDFPGLGGGVTLFVVVLIFASLLAGIGGYAGLLLSRYRKPG